MPIENLSFQQSNYCDLVKSDAALIIIDSFFKDSTIKMVFIDLSNPSPLLSKWRLIHIFSNCRSSYVLFCLIFFVKNSPLLFLPITLGSIDGYF